MFKRWQTEKLMHSLKIRRVVLLEGPRQCGKTTLAKHLLPPNSHYFTLDDITLLNSAINDPHGFVKHDNGLMIIDEVQRAPTLLQAVKQEVDINPANGRFLLTSSANIQTLPKVQESLAGRVCHIRLRPLALGEIYSNPPQFLDNAFAGEFKTSKDGLSEAEHFYDKDHYLFKALIGGFPEAFKFSNVKEAHRWHQDYINALLSKDLKEIINIRRKNSLNSLIEVLAAWSSKYMDISAIGRALSLSRPTLESYINALETLYLIERVRPWHKTDYDRVGKQDKLFMTDPGLMSASLKWQFDKVRLDSDMNGKLIETFVFSQLKAIIEANDHQYEIFHYRDREKREIDFLIENEKGDFLGVEIKAGSSVNLGSFKHLHWFAKNMAKGHSFKGVVLYSGQHIVPFAENMWAVPINALWA